MYAIIKCRFCGHVQGCLYPVKTTECKRCAKRNRLDKIGPLGIYKDLKEMQAHLIGMGWGDEDVSPAENLVIETKKKMIKPREIVLNMISDDGTDISDLLRELKEHGMEVEDIEDKLEELMNNGMIYSPRSGFFKKVE